MIDLLMWLLEWGTKSFIVLWLLYVIVMSLEKAPLWVKIVFSPALIIGYPLDVIFNLVFGTIIFLQWHHTKKLSKLTLTSRLRFILITEDENRWRWKLAHFLCKYFIEPWDFGHCGAGYFK
jgi:hypothetical protein